MPTSVLEAIRSGIWDFEPASTPEGKYNSTSAMPGSEEKLQVLAERVKAGLPLWHTADRVDYDEEDA